MMSAAGTTTMLSVMPRDLAMSLMNLSFSSSWIGFLEGSWAKALINCRLNVGEVSIFDETIASLNILPKFHSSKCLPHNFTASV